ncbi:malonate decarboxylase holo-ACP synthase [Mycobacterium sp. BMJ-28]
MEQLTSALPHDLLRLSPGAAELLPAEAPAWAVRAITGVPWVVVRRAEVPAARIAVGIRGTDRSQRHAWTIPWCMASETVTPQALSAATPVRQVAALQAVPAVRSIFGDLEWGPTGSVGFELATGSPVVTSSSDLDVVVRPARGQVLPPGRLREVHEQLSRLNVRVDCQVETHSGAVALAELVTGGDDVLIRTAGGPRLVPRSTVMW